MHAWTSRAQRYMRPYNLKARFTDQETEVQPETAGLSRATALLTPGLLLILLFCTSSLKILKSGCIKRSMSMKQLKPDIWDRKIMRIGNYPTPSNVATRFHSVNSVYWSASSFQTLTAPKTWWLSRWRRTRPPSPGPQCRPSSTGTWCAIPLLMETPGRFRWGRSRPAPSWRVWGRAWSTRSTCGPRRGTGRAGRLTPRPRQVREHCCLEMEALTC